MKPITFKEQNCTFAKYQDQYLPLPAFQTRDRQIITTCWELSFKEKVKIIFGFKFWLTIVTFDKPLQPISCSCEKPKALFILDGVKK